MTRGQLRGPRYLRLFHGIYVHRREGDGPLDLATRSRAAFLLLGDDGALAGYSAAELLGASCAPRRVPVEVVAPRTGIRPRPGLLVHRDALEPDEIWTAGGCQVTSPLRTAWDLARRVGPTEAVVVVVCAGPPGPVRAGRAAGPARGALRSALCPVPGRDRRPVRPAGRVADGVPAAAAAARPRAADAGAAVRAAGQLRRPARSLRPGLPARQTGPSSTTGEATHRPRRGADNHRDIDAAELGWETLRFEAPDIYVTPARTADAVSRMLAVRAPSR